MSDHFSHLIRWFGIVCLVLPLLPFPAAAADGPVRVCADPNDLPFSNARGRGFENMLAQMLAEDLGRPLEYEWTSQARGSLEAALRAQLCDVIIGVPWEPGRPGLTRSYYRSAWVFVTRAGKTVPGSLGEALSPAYRAGLRQPSVPTRRAAVSQLLPHLDSSTQVRSFAMHRAAPWPSGIRSLVDAVSFGEIDVAIAWGPAASYIANRSRVPLRMELIRGPNALPAFAGDIAMQVRSDDVQRVGELNLFLSRRAADIKQLLSDYRVPMVAASSQAGAI